MSDQKKSVLGRGLNALIPKNPRMEVNVRDGSVGYDTGETGIIASIDIAKIHPNPFQPRIDFDQDSLAELTRSIQEKGVIQPITVRRMDTGYQIISGERRLRATQAAHLRQIPAYIIAVETDEEMLELALIENIQREDLNAIEIALTFYRLMEEYKLTQERLSERVGKKRTTIANYLRLLRLPAEIQMGIKDKKIDMGHARAILGISEPAAQLHLYESILKNDYTVRKVEELVRLYLESGSFDSGTKSPVNPVKKLKEFDDLKTQLSQTFGTKVEFSCNPDGKGKISIPFSNDEELAHIMELFDKI